MIYRCLLAVALVLAVPAGVRGETHVLKFVKPIGVPAQQWMSFVAFSRDGSMVASDGPTAPDDTFMRLAFWSFPEGRLIRQLPVRPVALSRDWKYYADRHSVGEVDSLKPLVALPDDHHGTYAFSPDGRFVAESPSSRAQRRQIRLLELATGKEVSAFGKIATSAMAISPDGKTLGSGYWDQIILWNMLSGKRQASLRGFGRYVTGLAFSPDGRLLAAGTDAGELQIWDVRRRRRVHSFSIGVGSVSIPAFSPDGSLVAFGIYGTGTVWLMDVSSARIIDRQRISDLGCGSVAFSPDGRYLIAPSTGGLIKWPYDRGGTIRVFEINRAALHH